MVYVIYLGGIIGFRVINSLLTSLYFALILPLMHKCKNEMNIKAFVFCILHFMVFSIFFYGAIIYVLSDLFAIILCTMSICLLNKCDEEKNTIRQVVYAVLFGFFVYLSYNVRTIYLFAGIYLLLLFLIRQIRRNNSIFGKISSVLEGAAGGAMASFPQIYMNFIEPVGTALLNNLGIGGFENWSEFFSFLFHYPFEVAGIYVRHLINGLLPCWPNLYVADLDSNKLFLAIGAYVIIFLFLFACFNNSINNFKIISNYIGLLIPVLFIIPGAIEGRFFIAVYIMMIGVLCYNVEWIKMKEYLQTHWLKVAIMFVGGGGLIF